MGFPFLILTSIGLCFLDETPVFLLYKKKFEECKEVLKRITRINRRPEFRFHLLEELEEINDKYLTALDLTLPPRKITFAQENEFMDFDQKNKNLGTESNKISKIKVFKKHYRLFALWGVHYFAYFGIPLLIKSQKIYLLNFTALGLIELIGIYIASILLTNWSKRLILLKISVFCCFLFSLLHDLFNSFSFLFLMLLKFSLTIFFADLQIYTLENFAVQHRSKGFGYCFMFGRLFAITMPLLFGQFSFIELSPGLILTFMFLISFILIVYLKKENVDTLISDKKSKLINS